MSSKRIRHRPPQRPPAAQPASRAETDQAEVDDGAAELAVLWRAMPTALARDTAGGLDPVGDRHSSASKGSSATVNLAVIDAISRIETGLYQLEGEAVPLLNLDQALARKPIQVITSLPNWHRNLANRQPASAKHLRVELRAFVRDARGAIGTRRYDRKLGPLCPDHRDTKPTPLLQVGALAELDASLLAGPPPAAHLLRIGPACARGVHASCGHLSCERIRGEDRRILDGQARPTDWIASPQGPLWSPIDGRDAFRWKHSTEIRCPHCKTRWITVAERRILARRLAGLGDVARDAAGLVM